MSEPESLAIDEELERHVARHTLDRLIMLSDGVFAIAITLAAIEIHVPAAPSLTAVFDAMSVPLLAYLTSFIVIAVFWVSNRDLFARLRRIDRGLTALVLGTLCVTALIPASVRFSGPGHGDLGGGFRFYALVMVVSGMLNLSLWIYASIRPGIMSDQVPKPYRVRRIVETATLPLLFAAILLFPTVETLKWLAVVTVAVVAVRRLVLRAVLGRTPPKDADADTEAA